MTDKFKKAATIYQHLPNKRAAIIYQHLPDTAVQIMTGTFRSPKFISDPDLPLSCTCYACGLSHKKVEGGGLWYCPNYACIGNNDRSQYCKSDNDRYEFDVALNDAINDSLKLRKIKLLSQKFGI